MTKARLLLAAWLMIGFGAAARAQSSSDGGPSLAVTLQFIQDKVNGEGATLKRFDFGGGTGITPGASPILKVSGDPTACTLKITVSHADPTQGVATMTASLRDVVKVTATPEASLLQIRAAKPVFKLRTEFDFDPKGLRLRDPKVFNDNVLAFSFEFRDSDLATRVGKAAQHAVELCGGGPKAPQEPF